MTPETEEDRGLLAEPERPESEDGEAGRLPPDAQDTGASVADPDDVDSVDAAAADAAPEADPPEAATSEAPSADGPAESRPTGLDDPIGDDEQVGGASAEAQPQRPRALTIGVPLTALLVISAIALGILLAGATSGQEDRAAATAVAERVSTDMLRLSHDDSAEVIGGLLDNSTGPLRTQLTALSSTLTTVLRTGQVSAEGRIGSVGVERIDDTSAVVLVAAEATVRNTEIPQGQPRSYRIAVSLQKDGARWLASAVDFVA